MTERPLDLERAARGSTPAGRMPAERALLNAARTVRRACAVLITASLAATTAMPGDAWAQGVAVAEASEEDKARAQELYKSAAMSFEFRRWDDALRKFRESYGVVRSPNTHLMIARTLAELGQKTEAFNEAVATEAEARAAGERYADAASRSNELRAKLAREVAVLVVEVEAADGDPAAATVLVAGADLPRARWGAPFAMPPGEVEVVGRFHGEERGRRKVALRQGATESVKLVIGAQPGGEESTPPPAPVPIAATTASTPPATDDGSLIPLIAVSAGVGAGGLAVFTVFGLMNQATYDALEQRCESGCAAADVQDDVDEGETQQTIANVGLVVGAVGVAAAATLLVLELTDDDASPSAATGLRRVGVGPTGVVASGAF